MDADILIVGSGFGGAFAADALVRAGARVMVIERGPWRDSEPLRKLGGVKVRPFPKGRHALTHMMREVHAPWLPKQGIHLHRHGLFDIHLDPAMTVVCSSGVGGGSHVYSSMNTRPARSDYWDGHVDGVDAKTMAPLYDKAIQAMGARAPRHNEGIPNFTGDRLKDNPWLAAPINLPQPEMGYRFEQAQHSDNSYFGCARGDKVTLDTQLLQPLLERGLQVLAEHEAVDFGRARNGWRLTVRSPEGKFTHLHAPRLMLASGTLNTLRLLMEVRARGNVDELPGLGHGFGGNGDSIAWWDTQTKGADFTLGSPTHGRVVFKERETPGYLTLFGANGIEGLPLPQRLRRRLREGQILVAMGEDGANGLAEWKNRLRLRYRDADNPILREISQGFHHLAKQSGHPIWQMSRLTVHPFGGARVSQSEHTGMLDASGMVRGHSGLYVADASALPAAPGTPPSMSVAAWAMHVAQNISQQG